MHGDSALLQVGELHFVNLYTENDAVQGGLYVPMLFIFTQRGVLLFADRASVAERPGLDVSVVALPEEAIGLTDGDPRPDRGRAVVQEHVPREVAARTGARQAQLDGHRRLRRVEVVEVDHRRGRASGCGGAEGLVGWRAAHRERSARISASYEAPALPVGRPAGEPYARPRASSRSRRR